MHIAFRFEQLPSFLGRVLAPRPHFRDIKWLVVICGEAEFFFFLPFSLAHLVCAIYFLNIRREFPSKRIMHNLNNGEYSAIGESRKYSSSSAKSSGEKRTRKREGAGGERRRREREKESTGSSTRARCCCPCKSLSRRFHVRVQTGRGEQPLGVWRIGVVQRVYSRVVTGSMIPGENKLFFHTCRFSHRRCVFRRETAYI